MSITRRDFIVTTAGSAGVVGLLGFLPGQFQDEERLGGDRDWPDLTTGWRTSVCTGCVATCGIKGRIVDGRLVKITGNPIHPASQGGLCPKGLALTQAVHDPDRPLHCGYRSSDFGTDSALVRMPPDKALDLLAQRLKTAIASRGSEGVACIDGTGGQSGVSMLMRSLSRALKVSAYHARDPDAGLRLAARHVQGHASRPAYDLSRCQMILAFGSGFLEEDASPALRMRQLAGLRRQQEGRRPNLVVVEPRFSQSAARADRWVPIRPGTYGSLALGVAYVILKEGRHSVPFVRDRSEGFDDGSGPDGEVTRGFRSIVLKEGRPERVSQVTGIPVKTILEIGKLFSSSRAAVAVPTREVTWHSQGVRDAALIHSLNALIGNLDKPGGALSPLEVPLTPDPAVGGDAFEMAATTDAEALLLDVRAGKRPPPDVLLLVNAEPQEWAGVAGAWNEVRDRVPFVASIIARPGPSMRSADLVIPCATGLESFDLWTVPSPIGAPILGLEQPMMSPPGDARSAGDWILALAHRLGPRCRQALPWKSSREHVDYRLKGVYAAGRGMPFGTNLDSQHLKSLERRGWWPRLHSGLEEFIEAVEHSGGWWDPLYSYGQFGRVVKTPTGRYRFPTESEPRSARSPDTPVVEGSKTGLAVHAFPLLAFAGGSGGELPWLQPSVDSYARISWQPWVELNPKTAAELGIEDGQDIEAGNKKGRFRVRVRLFEGAMPGLLNVPIGFSPHSASRYADESGPDFFSIIGWGRDPVSGLACLSSTPVSVSPA